MSNRFRVLLGVSCLLVGGTTASAQFPTQPGFTPPYRPAVSPYINLLRSGSSPGVNYYGLVRPEQAFIQGYNQLNQRTLATDQALANAVNSQFVTGHAFGFQNQGSYFQNLGSGGGGAGFGTIGQGGGGAVGAGGLRAPSAASGAGGTGR